MNDDLRLPFFDPDFCLKITRWSAAACIGWLLIEVILLVAATPEKGSCSDWIIHRGEPSETPIGLLILLFTAAPTGWVSYHAFVRPRRMLERVHNSILRTPELNLNHNALLLIVLTGWALFCSAPLWFILSNCIRLFQPFGY
jgi:hypothetical protein